MVLGLLALAGCVTVQPDSGALLRDGDALFAARRYGDAGEEYQRAAGIAKARGDVTTQVEALSMAARSYCIRGLFEQGRPWLAQAKELASPDYPRGWSRYLGVRGRYEWQDEKDLPKATATFETMYDYCMEHALYNRAVDAAHMVAITGDDEQQIDWALKGIKAAELTGEESWLGPLWNNLGWAYHKRGAYQQSLDALLKAQHYHHLYSDKLAQVTSDVFVGMAYRHAGKPDEARQWITSAHKDALRMHLADPQDMHVMERLGNTHEQLAELLVLEGRPREASAQFTEAKRLYIAADAEDWGPEEIERVTKRIEALDVR